MRIKTLAQTTFREMMHEKIFAMVLVLAALVLALSFALGALSFSEQQKILADFGFLAIELSCLIISAFFGSYVIAREIEKQTCLLILSRPVSRGEFIFAKFLGVMILNFLIVLSLTVLLALLLEVWEKPGQIYNIALIALSIFLKSAIVTALAFALSQVVRPVIALMFTVVIYLLGHWLEDLRFFALKSKEGGLRLLVDILDWICPNFYKMNWKSWYFLENTPTNLEVSWAIVHSFGWILILVVWMQILFRRKDIV